MLGIKRNSKDIDFTNGWDSGPLEYGEKFAIVEFGSLKSDPKQGIVIVRGQKTDSGEIVSENRYLTPSKHGAVKVTNFNAFNLDVVANDGYIWIFNLFDKFRETPQF